mmetsp:Transcript_53070/g.95146  ORF Transcript_53070/g.95146 Transcript_53070/m.95146 type:complete len:102 (+) Transcript_53070:1047-1352(+)
MRLNECSHLEDTPHPSDVAGIPQYDHCSGMLKEGPKVRYSFRLHGCIVLIDASFIQEDASSGAPKEEYDYRGNCASQQTPAGVSVDPASVGPLGEAGKELH